MELLPQSRAATESVTNVHSNEIGYADFGRDQSTHGVVGADEVVRKMRVQTLHADPRTADTTAGLRAVALHRGSSPARGVLVVRSLERVRIYEFFEAMDSAIAFDAAHRGVEFGIDEPKERGHWGAVTQVRFVLDDDRSTIEVAHHNRATTSQWTAEYGFDNGEVLAGGVEKGQRQNSRVRTRRDTKAFADE